MKHSTVLYMWIPFLVAVLAACFKVIWLVPVTVILMFIVVAVLPCAHKRENLWLFILCAICSIPINIFLLSEYPQWRNMIYNSSSRMINVFSLIEMTLVSTSVEEVLVALIGRWIWKRQYALVLPEAEDDP